MMGSRTQSNRKEGQTGQVGCAGRINLAFIAGKGFSSLVLLLLQLNAADSGFLLASSAGGRPMLWLSLVLPAASE